MFAFQAPFETFRVQNAIHIGSARPPVGVGTMRPQHGKGFRIFPTAFEARPVTCGKGRYFIEKEKLRIVFAPDVAMTSVEFQDTADPLTADMPPSPQSPVVTMKSSATISQQRSAHVESD